MSRRETREKLGQTGAETAKYVCIPAGKPTESRIATSVSTISAREEHETSVCAIGEGVVKELESKIVYIMSAAAVNPPQVASFEYEC